MEGTSGVLSSNLSLKVGSALRSDWGAQSFIRSLRAPKCGQCTYILCVFVFSAKEDIQSCAETEWDIEIIVGWIWMSFRSRVVTSSMGFYPGVSGREL